MPLRRREAHVGRGRPRQTTNVGGSPASGSPAIRGRPVATVGPEAMSPRRSPRLMEDLNCNRAARHRVIRARPTVARARKHDHNFIFITRGFPGFIFVYFLPSFTPPLFSWSRRSLFRHVPCAGFSWSCRSLFRHVPCAGLSLLRPELLELVVLQWSCPVMSCCWWR